MNLVWTLVQSPAFSRLAFGLAGIGATGFIWWRAGSMHTVLEGLWQRGAGRGEAHTPALRSLLQESRDVDAFRFVYRLNADSTAQIRALAAWLTTHRMSMTQLRKARRWVDLGSPELIRKPPRLHIPGQFLLAAMFLLASIGAGLFAQSHDAYLQMRGTGVWFKTDAATVRAPWRGWTLDETQCAHDRSSVQQRTGFSARETAELCNSLNTEGFRDFVGATIRWQALAGGIGWCLALALAFHCLASARSARLALQLRGKRSTPIPAGSDTDRDAVEPEPPRSAG